MRISVKEVVKTLIEAIVLVFLVMYLFLQNWRATLIPTIAVPVVLLGTFGVMAAAGYSINTLTLFGLVLAIGLLVDDAIVVVENVERVMQEEGLSPKEATRKSMDQISGALVGIGLVLCAAFVPMAFFTGSSGVIYRQFSLTIVSSVALSVMVALILTPALCATMLKPMPKGHHAQKRGFFGWFNRVFDRTRGPLRQQRRRVSPAQRPRAHFLRGHRRRRSSCFSCARPPASCPMKTPACFSPWRSFRPARPASRRTKVLKKMENHFFEDEKDLIEGGFGVLGFSFSGNAQNQVLMFVKLKDWEERRRPEQKVKAIQGRAMAKFMQIKEAFAFAFAPPAVLELGTATGFDLRLVDLRRPRPRRAHERAAISCSACAMQNPVLATVRPNGLDDTPVYQIDIDQEKASALGLSLADINASLSTIWGSTYVNDFIDKGRVKKVIHPGRRALPHAARGREPLVCAQRARRHGALLRLLHRASGHSARRSSSASTARRPSPSSANPRRATAPAKPCARSRKWPRQLPPGIGIEWAGLSYEERLSGSKSTALYTIALLMVFLCLAALYESWAIPFSVMMDMPLGALGVVAATSLRGMPNDIYFQIGLITIIGLSAKNAILVVEFAKEHFDRGATLVDAALHAVRQRLRPILMTSIAFGLGVLPLALSKGAGSGSQNAIGTGIVGGAVTTTLLGLFFVPLYFVMVLRLFRVKPLRAQEEQSVPDSGEQVALSLKRASFRAASLRTA